jgi:uncharacterized membrane protein
MDITPTVLAGPGPAPSALRKSWLSFRGRVLGGLMLVLPILITFWVIYWLYSNLEKYLIDPLARLVIWKVRGGQADVELPYWFEAYAAPLIGLLIALLMLYALGFFVHSRMRRFLDWVLLRLPVISLVYNGVKSVFQALDKQPGKQRPQRMVLVAFPHPGMKVPAFVTSSCRDINTQKVILCVYVPTTPVPTSGYFLLVPEEEVTELNWSSEQALQAIISAGITAPPEVGYYKTRVAAEGKVATTLAPPAV